MVGFFSHQMIMRLTDKPSPFITNLDNSLIAYLQNVPSALHVLSQRYHNNLGEVQFSTAAEGGRV